MRQLKISILSFYNVDVRLNWTAPAVMDFQSHVALNPINPLTVAFQLVEPNTEAMTLTFCPVSFSLMICSEL